MRLVGKLLVWLVFAAATVYVGDWAVWKTKVAAGGGLGSVEVTNVVVAPLKGSKEEYYDNGTSVVTCSESLFPWSGAGACWYVRKHRTVEQR